MRTSLLFAVAFMAIGCGKAPPATVHGKTLDYWIAGLNHPDAKVRRKAAEVLGNVGAIESTVVPALVGALKDPDARIRNEAVLALLKIGPAAQEAVPALSESRHDRDVLVRKHAVKALERIKNEK